MFHILDGGAEEEKNKRIFSPSRQPISFNDLLTTVLCRGIGAGLLRLGTAFQSGAILAPLILTYTGILSWFSVQMIIRVYAKTKANSYEEAWNALFGHKSVFIMVFFSTVSTTSVLCSYSNLVISSSRSLVESLGIDAPWYTTDSLSLALFFGVFFYLPLCFNNSAKLLVKFSYIKMTLVVILMAYMIYMFINYLVVDGFDPSGQLELFRFDSHALSTIGSFADAYLVLPLSFPGVRNLVGANIASLRKIFTIAMIVFYLVYTIMGEISYFSFFDDNIGGVILNYYPKTVVRHISVIILIVMILLTSTLPMNTSRYLLITLGTHMEFIPSQMWFTIGIVIVIFFVIASAISPVMLTFIGYISNITSLLYLFILPPIFYRKAFKDMEPWKYIVGVVLIASGVGAIALSIYSSL